MPRKVPSQKLPCGRPLPAQAGLLDISANTRKWQAILSEHLRKKKLKQSESRNQILEVMATFSGHFSTSELVTKVQKSCPGVGAATVYRNIPVFLECGVIQETLMDELGQKIFEMSSEGDEHHDHIVCVDCNHIFEFHEPAIEDAQNVVSENLRFEVVGHRHVIYGRCEFRNARENRRP